MTIYVLDFLMDNLMPFFHLEILNPVILNQILKIYLLFMADTPRF